MRWAILVIASQREFPVTAKLARDQGLKPYIPAHVINRTRSGRTLHLLRPLMPGYAFVGDRDQGFDWRVIDETDGVIGWLSADGKPVLLSETEIIRIRAVEDEHNRALRAMPRGPVIKPGDRVTVPESPFASVELLVRRVLGRRVSLEVQMLGSKRELTVPASAVRVVE